MFHEEKPGLVCVQSWWVQEDEPQSGQQCEPSQSPSVDSRFGTVTTPSGPSCSLCWTFSFTRKHPCFRRWPHRELVASQVPGARLALLCIEQMVAFDSQVGISFPSSRQCQPPTAICSSSPAGYFYHGMGKKSDAISSHFPLKQSHQLLSKTS